jgi:hypothetical protein
MIQKNSSYIGKLVYSKGETVNVRKMGNITSPIIMVAKRMVNNVVASFGVANGFIYNESPNTWFSVALNDGRTGWVRSDVISMSAALSNDAPAQDLINKLIDSDETILKNLVKSRVIIETARKNKTLTNAHVNTYNALITRHSARQNKIKSSKLLKVQTGVSKAYSDLMTKMGLSSLKISGVGAVPVIAWVLGAVVITGTSAAVTAAFLGAFKESASDLVVSANLEKALSTLSPQAAQEVKEELQEQIDNAYKEGAASGSGSTMLSNIKTLGLVLLGAFAANKFLNNK